MDDATTKTKEILIVETVADETDRTVNHEATEEDLETVKIRTTVGTTVETKVKTGAAATQEGRTTRRLQRRGTNQRKIPLRD